MNIELLKPNILGGITGAVTGFAGWLGNGINWLANNVGEPINKGIDWAKGKLWGYAGKLIGTGAGFVNSSLNLVSIVPFVGPSISNPVRSTVIASLSAIHSSLTSLQDSILSNSDWIEKTADRLSVTGMGMIGAGSASMVTGIGTPFAFPTMIAGAGMLVAGSVMDVSVWGAKESAGKANGWDRLRGLFGFLTFLPEVGGVGKIAGSAGKLVKGGKTVGSVAKGLREVSILEKIGKMFGVVDDGKSLFKKYIGLDIIEKRIDDIPRLLNEQYINGKKIIIDQSGSELYEEFKNLKPSQKIHLKTLRPYIERYAAKFSVDIKRIRYAIINSWAESDFDTLFLDEARSATNILRRGTISHEMGHMRIDNIRFDTPEDAAKFTRNTYEGVSYWWHELEADAMVLSKAGKKEFLKRLVSRGEEVLRMDGKNMEAEDISELISIERLSRHSNDAKLQASLYNKVMEIIQLGKFTDNQYRTVSEIFDLTINRILKSRGNSVLDVDEANKLLQNLVRIFES